MSVYFMASNGYIKVGYSANPLERASSVTRGKREMRPEGVERGADVEIIGWFPGAHQVERAAHLALGQHWVVGEWFNDCPEVRDYLRAQDEALILSECSAFAVWAVQAGMPVAEAMARYPLNTRPVAEVLDDMAIFRSAS